MKSILSSCCFCLKSQPDINEISTEAAAAPLLTNGFDSWLKDTPNVFSTPRRSSRHDNTMSQVQKYKIILLDDSITPEVPSSMLRQIQSPVSESERYTDIKESTERIKKASENIIFVTSKGQKVADILSECGDLPQLKAIYVLDQKVDPIMNRKVAYFPDSITLTQQIVYDTQSSIQEPPAINFFDRNQQTMRDLSKEAASFMWSQMLLDVLRQFSNDAHALHDMISMCQEQYRDSPVQLNKIEEFRVNYNGSNAIQCEEALKIYEKSLPDNHPKRIDAIIALGGTYEALGQFKKALDYLNQALNIQNRYFSEDHPSRAQTLRSIGINEQILGNWDRAFDNYCKAYSIWMLQFPQGHVYTAYCLNLIGSIYRVQKQFDEALSCQLNALAMRTSLFPPGTPQPYSSLGLTYLDMEETEKAIETLKLACHYWQTKSADPSNMYLNSIETYLATAYSHNGQLKEAQELFERVLRLQRNSHPQGHPDIGFTLHHMASNLVRMNEYNRGMKCYQESLDMLLKFFEDDHYEVVMIRKKMETLDCYSKKLQFDEIVSVTM
ncbi:unnamed protein product [Rotaria sp. Silwood1]|nr:unnamed protein product [Rotaria sp. Silwood1]